MFQIALLSFQQDGLCLSPPCHIPELTELATAATTHTCSTVHTLPAHKNALYMFVFPKLITECDYWLLTIVVVWVNQYLRHGLNQVSTD